MNDISSPATPIISRLVRCLIAALLALAAITPATAAAQDDPASDEATETDREEADSPDTSDNGERRTLEDLSDDEKEELNVLVESAKEAYRDEKYEKAIPFLEQAYDILPKPAFYFRIARSYEHAGNPEKALEFYEKYLDEKPETPKRGEVESRIDQLEQTLAEAEQTDDDETRDGQAESVDTDAAETDGLSGRQVAGITLTGTGGAFAVGAVVFGVLFANADQKYRNAETRPVAKKREKTRNLFLGGTYGTAALGASGLGVGIYLLASGPPDGRASNLAAPTGNWSVTLGPGGIGISATFR